MAKSQLNKLIWLVNTIYHSKRITFSEINRRWKNGDKERENIPLRTFHNHRESIEEIFDINIECDKHTNEYYIENSEDIFNDKLKMWLLNSFSLNNILHENADMKARILFEEIPSGIQFIDTIVQAMRSSFQIEMEYQAYTWSNSHQLIIEPYFLRLFKQRWYLIGVNTFHNQIRSYALDRVKGITLGEKKFKYPSKFTPADYYKDSFGIITENEKVPTKTVLKVSAEQAPYIRNLPFHCSQNEIECNDEYSIFELHICHTYDFIQELLSMGEDLEILEPADLKNEVYLKLKRMVQKYETKE